MSDPTPPVQGVVTAVIQPIVFKKANAGESTTKAVGVALDANGNPIDQTEELKKLLGGDPK